MNKFVIVENTIIIICHIHGPIISYYDYDELPLTQKLVVGNGIWKRSSPLGNDPPECAMLKLHT